MRVMAGNAPSAQETDEDQHTPIPTYPIGIKLEGDNGRFNTVQMFPEIFVTVWSKQAAKRNTVFHLNLMSFHYHPQQPPHWSESHCTLHLHLHWHAMLSDSKDDLESLESWIFISGVKYWFLNTLSVFKEKMVWTCRGLCGTLTRAHENINGWPFPL